MKRTALRTIAIQKRGCTDDGDKKEAPNAKFTNSQDLHRYYIMCTSLRMTWHCDCHLLFFCACCNFFTLAVLVCVHTHIVKLQMYI